MASPDAHVGAAVPLASASRNAGWFRRQGLAVGAILIVSALGWVMLWRMADAHVSAGGGYGTLGPGMAVLDELFRLAGINGAPTEGLWGDICRAFATVSGPQSGVWPLGQFWAALAMWMLMAVAMMLPTAIPVIAAFGDIQQAARAKGLVVTSVWVFCSGYLVTWGGLAVAAAALQWGLNVSMGEEPVFATSAPAVGGALLVLAGLYQWSALKAACLSQCRSPMRFFMTHWRDGHMGAFRMGVRHGVFCVGCCWAMMLLMFVGGTMNLAWMAVLTLIMLLEKILPRGKQVGSHGPDVVFSRSVGVVFVTWGAVLLVSGFTQIGMF